MRRLIPLALILGIAFAAAPANAQQQPPVGGPERGPGGTRDQPPTATIMAEPIALFFAGCDADRDARVTRDEVIACVAKSFALIDTEGRGSIGYIQFSDWSQRWLGDRNALPSPYETDANDDNRITLAELQAVTDRIFRRLDKNADGVLDRAEMLTLNLRSAIIPDVEGRRGRVRRP